MSPSTSKNPSILSRIGMFFGLALLGLFFISKVKSGYEAYQLLEADSTVDAVCTYRTYGRDGGTKYAFTINGQTYYGEARNQRLDEGTTLKVVFLESKPSINRPVDGVSFDVWVGGFFATFLIVSVILLCFFQLRRRPALNEIVDAETDRTSPSSLAA